MDMYPYTELMIEKHPIFPHRHDLYEIIYVVDGCCQFGCGEKTETISPQDLIFIGKDQLHRITYFPEQTVTYFAVIFDIVLKKTPLPTEAYLECAKIMNTLNQINKDHYRRGHSQNPQNIF